MMIEFLILTFLFVLNATNLKEETKWRRAASGGPCVMM